MLTMMRRLPEETVYDCITSPVGELYLVASNEDLRAVLWGQDLLDKECQVIFSSMKKDKSHSILRETRSQLREYFKGERLDFDIPLTMDGTDFQKKAWRQLQKIPYGSTLSYQQQAKKLGDMKWARAVGTANSRNPISIVIPCHRVISKNGSLSGFGGGINNKKYLLQLEQGNV